MTRTKKQFLSKISKWKNFLSDWRTGLEQAEQRERREDSRRPRRTTWPASRRHQPPPRGISSAAASTNVSSRPRLRSRTPLSSGENGSATWEGRVGGGRRRGSSGGGCKATWPFTSWPPAHKEVFTAHQSHHPGRPCTSVPVRAHQKKRRREHVRGEQRPGGQEENSRERTASWIKPSVFCTFVSLSLS